MYCRSLLVILLSLASASVLGQADGSLSYAPIEVVPIPAPVLIIASFGLVLAGFVALRRQGARNILGQLLALSGSIVLLAATFEVHDVRAIIPMPELSNPEGGSADIGFDLQQFSNTSGVDLIVTAVTPPEHCGSVAVSTHCFAGLKLAAGAMCQTNYVACITPEVSISDLSSGAEGETPVDGRFTLLRSGNPDDSLTVTYSLAGTATEGSDYTVPSVSSVVFPAGETSIDIVISVLDDRVYDPLETVVLTLSDGAEYDLGTIASDSIEIVAADKRVFLTAPAQTDPSKRYFNGDLRAPGDTGSSGIAGADAKCNADANKPVDGGDFKAMLAGDERSASPQMDWVLTPGSSYFRVPSTFIARANASALFDFPVATSLGAGLRVWTGMEKNWTSSATNCNNWTSGISADKATVGGAAKTSAGLINVTTVGCAATSSVAALICVEQ